MKTSLFFIPLIVITTTAPENFISKHVKQWISSSFGVDPNEPLDETPFHPTVANLHALTILPTSAIEGLSVSQLVQNIQNAEQPQTEILTLTHEEQKTCWEVTPGIRTKPGQTAFVYSRGYAGARASQNPHPSNNHNPQKKPRGMCAIPKQGGSIVVGAEWLKRKIVPGPCIFFDYPDTRHYFDFGLKHDCESLEVIHHELTEINNNDVVYFGNCRGSKALLYFLARAQPRNVKAVILEAPFLDLEQFTQEVEKNYGTYVPFSKHIAQKIITYWHPSYNKDDDLTLEDLKNIPQEIPIFIAHLYHDQLVADQLIKQMVHTLRDSGHKVYALVINDETKAHSRLYQTEPFVLAVNAFLKTCGLEHSPEHAHKGRFLLNNASYNVKHIDSWNKPGFPHVYRCKP